MWVGAVQAFPLSFSKSPFTSDFFQFLHCTSLRQKCRFFILWTNICWILSWNYSFFFSCARSELGILQVGRWCSDIEQRMKKQSIRPCCCFLLSSSPRKSTSQCISKEYGKRHLIIVIMFKQRISRNIAHFRGLS